jgi:hypothetical protein
MPDGRQSYCRGCKQEANQESIRRRRASNPEAERETEREYRRQWRAANPEASQRLTRESMRRQHAAHRDVVFDHYGRACACCGSEVKPTIDHVDGGGRAHRAQIGHGSGNLYRWLVANDFPDGFQALCYPCNRSKRDGERCQINHEAVCVR